MRVSMALLVAHHYGTFETASSEFRHTIEFSAYLRANPVGPLFAVYRALAIVAFPALLARAQFLVSSTSRESLLQMVSPPSVDSRLIHCFLNLPFTEQTAIFLRSGV